MVTHVSRGKDCAIANLLRRPSSSTDSCLVTVSSTGSEGSDDYMRHVCTKLLSQASHLATGTPQDSFPSMVMKVTTLIRV